MKNIICFLLCIITVTCTALAAEYDNYYPYDELPLPADEQMQEFINAVFFEHIYNSTTLSGGEKATVAKGDVKLTKEDLIRVSKNNNFIRTFIPFIYKIVKSEDQYAIYVKAIGYSWMPEAVKEKWENGSLFDLDVLRKEYENYKKTMIKENPGFVDFLAFGWELGMPSKDVFVILAKVEQGNGNRLKYEKHYYYRYSFLGYDDFIMFGKVPIMELEKQDLFLYFRQALIDIIQNKKTHKNLILKEYDFE